MEFYCNKQRNNVVSMYNFYINSDMSSESEKIQRYIIKSTPFGELTDVLKDLDKVSAIDLSSPALQSTVEEYNEEHLAIIHHKEGQFLTMSTNKLGQNQYLDQLNEKAFTIDPFKQEVVSEADHPVELMDQVKELVKYLSKDAQEYTDRYFKNPNGSQVFAEISEDGLIIHLGITGKNISLGKFYTGEWISKWRITKDSIEGQAQIKAHFFEAGNVQFNQKRNLKQEFQFTAAMNENSKMIVQVIEKFEATVQEQLNAIYDEMPNKFFKNLRRLAPYTKTKMSWNINAIKMNQNLLGSQK